MSVDGDRLPWQSRLLDRLVAPVLKLPRATHGVRRVQTQVPTRDGEQLMTDVYLPVGDLAKATVLIRSPYGRGFPLDVSQVRPLAARGYQVVVQSCRGRSGSTGSFEPMVNEGADGQDTVSWLREQPWFTGRLATVGGSYLGFAQWALLVEPPPELAACVVVVGPHDFAAGIYGSGAFALGDFFGWSEAMTAPEGESPVKQARRMSAARKRDGAALNALPLPTAGEALLGGKAPWFPQWAEHDDLDDPFWSAYRLGAALESTSVPTLLVGGWYDGFLDQTLEQHAVLTSREVPVELTIGPWRHFDTVTKAAAEVTRETLTFLDRRLAPAGDTKPLPPVRTYVTGAGEWRRGDRWPSATTDVELFLARGALTPGPSDDGATTFTFDPADPTPSVGGRVLDPHGAGPREQKQLLSRADVVSFHGEPLAEPWEICGRPEVALSISVSNPHADVFVRLCEVDRKGRTTNLADGFLRLDPSADADQVQHIVMELDPCHHQVAKGHRLLLLIAGGAHPRYARNLGTGEPVDKGTATAVQPHTVHHAGTTLLLPLA